MPTKERDLAPGAGSDTRFLTPLPCLASEPTDLHRSSPWSGSPEHDPHDGSRPLKATARTLPDVEPDTGTKRVRGRQGLHLLVWGARGLDVSWGARSTSTPARPASSSLCASTPCPSTPTPSPTTTRSAKPPGSTPPGSTRCRSTRAAHPDRADAHRPRHSPKARGQPSPTGATDLTTAPRVSAGRVRCAEFRAPTRRMNPCTWVTRSRGCRMCRFLRARLSPAVNLAPSSRRPRGWSQPVHPRIPHQTGAPERHPVPAGCSTPPTLGPPY
jgi:hypothetical protein